ncbi:MAG: T9SS type A sorting domain-containing protein [Bacteroidota bacterium]
MGRLRQHKWHELTCNFKLLNSGEKIILSQGTTIFDSISFGFQGADISLARCPDGTEPFVAVSNPTYNSSNCAVGLFENSFYNSTISIFPNPANQSFTIQSSLQKPLQIDIINSVGEKILSETLQQKKEINTSAFSQGIYFISISGTTFKLVITH